MRALIIDGRAEMRKLLIDFARLKGFNLVVSASGGHDALLILMKVNMSGKKFDLAIISRETAGAPLGYVVEQARRVEKGIKFLVLTTTPDFPKVALEVAKLGRGIAAAHEPINFEVFETLVDGLGILKATKASVETEAPETFADLFTSPVPPGERTH